MLKKFLVFSFLVLLSCYAGVAALAEEAVKPAGKPLPADGGEPGKAYMEYCKAMTAGDMAALKKLVATERAKAMDDPQFKEMFPMIQSMMAKNIKITGGTATDKDATLEVEGTDPMGEGVSKGTVHLVLDGKQWKVEKDSWKSEMK